MEIGGDHIEPELLSACAELVQKAVWAHVDPIEKTTIIGKILFNSCVQTTCNIVLTHVWTIPALS